ncbi:AraC family transcriptional regulator [Mucilaginibacter phyllosphaerae]|uniref:AraC-like DNA-binding protein n=1 Tax=Mucilaginibacter phyllosphaerae TaxID=1812349 RepID=A0A4Y8AJ64_9SPHI|nr:helix-turn-helix transcriptional regulator [Mucilaginibacter phyllosphaerae]MBB3967882.1 AraC-like DNA-binding protein [Mucilaginibacter phyllosphaerae]TEW69076.1 helix-turn-helix domain-containing protein [Mucilaginibacter phyllosphaerae]GGH02689.1 AraC family transcriptional regulator [Mucilaginibacter phyllosphaerae]
MKKAFPVYDICSLAGHQHDDLLISRFAPYLQKHQNLSLPHKHTFYHVVLFTQGAGKHAIDFKSFAVKPYQIYFMIPGQVHRWEFEGPVDGYIINFSAELFQSFLLRPDYLESLPFFSGNADDEVINLPAVAHGQITQLFEQLLTESLLPGRMGIDMIRTLMLQLFILVARQGKQANQTVAPAYNYTLLQSFRKLTDKNFATLKLPKDYAALLYITPNHLNALCNDMLGIPAGEVIRNRVILEAKRLLINLDMNISEIAGKLNFADNSYFTKFFKKYTGLTPEDFRKNPVA